MALGIVSANDQGAIWREAASDKEWNAQTGQYEKPSTSEPPSGAKPDSAGQDVVIPNSNKFKTPANGLKKLLETTSSGGFDPKSTLAVHSWLQAHPAFTKTYFKPGYAPALKTHLGDENYAKLMQHAPTPYSDLLIHHQQQPTPNSNKFKTPANGLKKLLDANPSQQQVQQWVADHPAFHTYLGPEYEDALKNHVGEVNFAKLKIHTQGGSAKPAEQPLSPGDQVKKNITEQMAPAGFKPITQEQALGGPSAPPVQPQSGNSPHYDTIKDISKKGYSPTTVDAIESPAFHTWFHSHSLEEQKHLSYTPGGTSTKFLKWLAKHPEADNTVPQAKQELVPPTKDPSGVLPPEKQFGTPESKGHSTAPPPGVDKSNSQHPALLAQIKKVFPNAHTDLDGMSDDQLKAQLETWLHYLPEHKGPQNFDTHVPQLQKIYDQWFGSKGQQDTSSDVQSGGPVSSEDSGDTSDNPVDGYYQALTDNSAGQPYINTFALPTFKKWWAGLDEKHKDYYSKSGNGQEAVIDYALQGDDEPDQGKQEQTFGQMAVELFPQAFGESKGKEFDALPPDKQAYYLKSWLKSGQGAGTPGATEKMQAFYDKHFGDQPQQGTLKEKLQGDLPNDTLEGEFYNQTGYYVPKGWPGWDDSQKKSWLEKMQVAGGSKIQDVAKALLQKYYGDQTKPETSGTTIPTGLPMAQEITKAVGGVPALLKSDGKLIQDMDPDEVKATLEKWMAPNSGVDTASQVELADIYNKYFGGSPSPQKGYTSDQFDALNKAYSDIFGIPPDHSGLGHKDDPKAVELALLNQVKDWQEAVDAPEGEWAAPKAKKLKDLYQQYFGGGEQSPDVGPTQPPVDKMALVQELADNLGGGVSANYINSMGTKYKDMSDEQLKAKLQNLIDTGNSWAAKGKVQELLDKYYGGGGSSAGSSSLSTTQDLQDKLNEIYPGWLKHPGYFDQHANMPVSKFFDMWDKGTGLTPDQKQKFKQVFQQWQATHPNEQATSKGPPPWDPQVFANEYNQIVPNSGSSVAQGGATSEKALGKLQQLISDYPDTEQTEKLKALKQKWFPEGIQTATPGKGDPGPVNIGDPSKWAGAFTSNGKPTPEFAKWIKQEKDLDLLGDDVDIAEDGWKKLNNPDYKGGVWSGLVKKFQDQQGGLAPSGGVPEPDEDEGVTPPAKSKDPTPAELQSFQTNKPQNAADWKQFSNWWGATKLTPEQEQAIYKSWFPNKNASPEQASKWFQKVYDFHSKPGSGDLGQNDMPAWAQNSWAFGDKAKKEWPVFKEWAAKAPGLPPNLSIKQKLQVWNNLSAGDKKVIEGNYLPKNPVDAQAVVAGLQKAYPQSDFSAWAKMPQGTLKENVEMLAKAGYGGAVPIFNSVYGGSYPMPKEKKEEAPQGIPEPPQIPVDKLPEWWTNNYGKSAKQAKTYSGFHHMMSLLGLKDTAEAGGMSAKQGLMAWNNTPPWLQQQIGSMSSAPFKNVDEYNQWVDDQDNPLKTLQQIYPEEYANPSSFVVNSLTKKTAYGLHRSAQVMGQKIDAEQDPVKKQALLAAYHKFFGQHETLEQALEKVYPVPPKGLKAANWAEYLSTHSTEEVGAAVKKLMKAEQDPEKFVQMVDAWGKYVGGNSGMGAVTNTVGKGWTAGSTPSTNSLKQLWLWKKNGGGAASAVPSYWSLNDDDVTSPFIKNKVLAGDEGSYYPAYHGLTPKVYTSSGGKPDPALMGSSGEPNYVAPEKTQGKYVKLLQDKVSDQSGAYSSKDKATFDSDEFQSWFEAQSTPYKKVFSAQPGTALDDYHAFMAGDVAGQDVEQGTPVNYKFTNPYDLAPKATGPNKVRMQDGETITVPTIKLQPKYPGWSRNPVPGMGRPNVNWPSEQGPTYDYEDPETKQKYKIPQMELPLPADESFVDPKQLHELHRGMILNLGHKRIKRDNMLRPIKDEKGNYVTDDDPLVQEISRILHGSGDETYPKDNEDLYNQLAKEVMDKSKWVPEETLKKQNWYSYGPGGQSYNDTMTNKTQALDFAKFIMEKHPPPEQMYELAKKWGLAKPEDYGIPPPGKMPGSYTAPGLSNKLMDYLESSGYEETKSHPERYLPGFGNHWTQSWDTAQSFGGGSTSYNELPVMVSALWNGVGEDPERTGTGTATTSLAPASHESEKEVTLAPGAPVQVKNVRIRPHVAVPQGKPITESKLRQMAGYLFPNENSSFREKWAKEQNEDDAQHWYDTTVPWLKKNADWKNWVANTPAGDWIEIPVEKQMRYAKKENSMARLSDYERRITALFHDEEDPYGQLMKSEHDEGQHPEHREGWPTEPPPELIYGSFSPLQTLHMAAVEDQW